MNLVLTIKNDGSLMLELKQGRKVVDHENLTNSQGFDKLLITAIDKLLARNKIDRLSLKSLEIRGKLNKESVLSMVLGAVKAAVGV